MIPQSLYTHNSIKTLCSLPIALLFILKLYYPTRAQPFFEMVLHSPPLDHQRLTFSSLELTTPSDTYSAAKKKHALLAVCELDGLNIFYRLAM